MAAFPSKEASLIIHALAVAILVRIAVAKYSPNWLLHLVFYLFVTRASDTARAILLGKPITWLADDHAIMHYLPIWYGFDDTTMHTLSSPLSLLLNAVFQYYFIIFLPLLV